MMRTLLLAATATCFCLFGGGAKAQEIATPAGQSVPDLGQCSALLDEKAYGKKYNDYSYLIQGNDGWVFRSRLDFKMDYGMSEEVLALFQKLTTALRDRGTELVIAYMPLRGMAASNHIPRDHPVVKESQYDPEIAKKNYIEFLSQMNKSGLAFVGTPDIKAGERYFYKADQHWTTEGSREMAQAVAAYIKNMRVYKKIDKAPYATQDTKKISFSGSFNKALKEMCNIQMPNETDVMKETVASGKGAADENALFGEVAAPEIVLVGTSNSKREDQDVNFEGYLKEFLSADVLNAAITGGGFDDPLIAYLNSEEFRKNPPKIMIWEIPGYYDLKGESSRDLLRQAIPGVYGDCGPSHLAESSLVSIEDEKTVVLEGLDNLAIKPDQSYLTLRFDAPVKKHFSVSLLNSEKERRTFKFKRSKRYPSDGLFFYAPKGLGETVLSSVSLKTPEEMDGLKVQARLCSYPQGKPSVLGKVKGFLHKQ